MPGFWENLRFPGEREMDDLHGAQGQDMATYVSFPSPSEGSNFPAGGFYDLYRDPREERRLDSTKVGVWAGGQFAAMIERHMAMKKHYPDRALKRGVPYTGIENLRPETKELVRILQAGLPKK